MTHLFSKAGLAVAMTATALTAAAPVEAQRYGGYRHDDHTGTAIVAGIAGLAIGAAIASSSRHDDRYRDRGYAYQRDDRGYGYGYRDGRYDDGRYGDQYRRGYDERGQYGGRGYGQGYGQAYGSYDGYRGCHIETRYDRYSGRSIATRVCD